MPGFTGFDAIADRAGFLAVYPDGFDKYWADGRPPLEHDESRVDDVGFVAALLDDMARAYLIDVGEGGKPCQRYVDICFCLRC